MCRYEVYTDPAAVAQEHVVIKPITLAIIEARELGRRASAALAPVGVVTG